MDATYSIRQFLSDSKIHNYENQKQGIEHKVIKQAILIANDFITETRVSFYRPETKNGDPRIWIYGLKEKASNFDLLALLKGKNQLIIFNCSNLNIENFFQRERNLLNQLFDTENLSIIAEELLEKCKKINKKGFVKTLRAGDTGVGYTFESLLGIKSNSNKSPDFKGIEIKSSRKKFQKSSGRSTIFSQVPNWKISRLKGSKEILFTRGKYHEQKKRMQLFHEFSALKINSYNMKLLLDHNKDLLHQIYVKDESSVIDVTWEIEVLKRRLREKHKETFWVSAMTKGKNGDVNEEFLFSEVKHTGEVDFNIFPTLIETGVITLDYTIKEAKKNVAKDQGYLFKISSKNLDLLFSKISHYSLA